PCIAAAADAGLDDVALRLERQAYLHCCRAVEDEEHTTNFFRAIAGPLTALGRRRGQALPAAALPEPATPLVAFAFQFAAEAAHTEVATDVLEALVRAPVPSIRPVVYLLESGAGLQERLRRADVPTVVVGEG